MGATRSIFRKFFVSIIDTLVFHDYNIFLLYLFGKFLHLLSINYSLAIATLAIHEYNIFLHYIRKIIEFVTCKLLARWELNQKYFSLTHMQYMSIILFYTKCLESFCICGTLTIGQTRGQSEILQSHTHAKHEYNIFLYCVRKFLAFGTCKLLDRW